MIISQLNDLIKEGHKITALSSETLNKAYCTPIFFIYALTDEGILEEFQYFDEEQRDEAINEAVDFFGFDVI